MKKIFFLFLMLVSLKAAIAQSPALVLDKEGLFTPNEISRLDSQLQQYRLRTGNIVLVASDTADISSGQYADNLVRAFVPDSTQRTFVFMFLLSRKNQLLFASVNSKLKPYVTDALLLDILQTGIPDIKEKRRAEGTLLICKKAMEFLDGLREK